MWFSSVVGPRTCSLEAAGLRDLHEAAREGNVEAFLKAIKNAGAKAGGGVDGAARGEARELWRLNVWGEARSSGVTCHYVAS